MVKQHKKDTRKKQKERERAQKMEEMGDTSNADVRVHVKELSTGKILRGEEAPLASELEAWMEKNPGWEEVPRDEDSDDDSDDWSQKEGEIGDADVIAKAKKEAKDEGEDNRDYYAIAHTVTETVTKQSSLLVGGELKEYQVKGLEWLVSLYNNNLNGILGMFSHKMWMITVFCHKLSALVHIWNEVDNFEAILFQMTKSCYFKDYIIWFLF